MNDKLVNKYLPNASNKPKPNKSNQPEIPKTPKDAQKAVETMAARLAVDVLDIDDTFGRKVVDPTGTWILPVLKQEQTCLNYIRIQR